MIMVNLRKQRKNSGRHNWVLPLFHFKASLFTGWAFVFGAQLSFADAVTARVASVKGTVTRSSGNAGFEPLQRGASMRAGTVISTAVDSAMLLRPAPKVNLVSYMTTKIRFDGTTLDDQGGGSVKCFLLSGRVLLSIDPEAKTAEGTSKVDVSIATEEGEVLGKNGTWVVQHDDGRTLVAVSLGKVDVTIDHGSSSDGGVSGRVEVTEGSVIWLERRAEGDVEAIVVNVRSGTMVRLNGDGTQGPVQKAPPEVLVMSQNLLSLSGDSTAMATPTTGSMGRTSTINPDFSSPQPVLPIVSADTP